MIIMNKGASLLIRFSLMIFTMLLVVNCFGQQSPVPPRPTGTPRLVNDFANVLNSEERAELEAKLVEIANSTSTQITIVTVKTIGTYDVAQFNTELGQKWGVGTAGKDNGVVILASIEDRRANIAVGRGLEHVLTDLQAGRIIKNEMGPEFKHQRYFEGFMKAADAVIAATRGEYKADKKDEGAGGPGSVVLVILMVLVVLFLMGRGGGKGGGGYMSRRGSRGFGGGFLGGFLGGSMLGGGGFGGGSGGGFGGGSGSGFGGFGGGSFGGGGASGSW